MWTTCARRQRSWRPDGLVLRNAPQDECRGGDFVGGTIERDSALAKGAEMVRSVLEQYNVAQFIEWNDKKQLTLNPNFQRRSVWTLDGKSYLVDTLLRGLPMPKVYMRTTIDVSSQRAVRDIVDGQQRMRAILDFAKGDLRLNKRAGEFSGQRYADIGEELQESFLTYPISVEQLINATDDDVLEVFARLNSYTVPLNGAELRHARYQSDFKWKVREAATQLSDFWRKYNVLSTRDRLRMLDDEVTAELFGIILEGVRNGGQPNLKRLYDNHDREFPEADLVAQRVHETIEFLDTQVGQALSGGVFSRPPQLLMLFAVVAHAKFGIPPGEMGDDFPRDHRVEIDVDTFGQNLAVITNAVLDPAGSDRFLDFVLASTSTQRITSRRLRFRYLWTALTQRL